MAGVGVAVTQTDNGFASVCGQAGMSGFELTASVCGQAGMSGFELTASLCGQAGMSGFELASMILTSCQTRYPGGEGLCGAMVRRGGRSRTVSAHYTARPIQQRAPQIEENVEL